MQMIDELMEQLHATDPSERRYALEALYDHCCDDGVLETAAHLLADTDRGVREAASHILVLCSNDRAASLAAVHISSPIIAVRNLAGDVLVRMGGPAINAILPYIDSADKDIRKFSVDLIAQLPTTPVSVGKIAGRLTDPDPNVVCASIDALGAMHAGEHLQQMLDLFDEVEYARPNVVNAAAKFQEEAKSQFFLKALSDEDPVVQLGAAEALSVRKDGGILEVLLSKFATVSELAKPVILHSIVVLLESTGYKGEIPGYLKPSLLAMLGDSDTAYVRAAVRGLGYFLDDAVIEAFVSHAGMSESVDSAILSELKKYPERVIPIAIAHARRAGDLAVPAMLVISLIQGMQENDPNPLPAKVLDEAASFIAGSFGRLDADMKMTALGVCGSFRTSSAVDVIKSGLGDPEPAVKSLALDLAAKTGPQFFGPELLVLKDDYDEEVRFAASALITQLNPGRRKRD